MGLGGGGSGSSGGQGNDGGAGPGGIGDGPGSGSSGNSGGSLGDGGITGGDRGLSGLDGGASISDGGPVGAAGLGSLGEGGFNSDPNIGDIDSMADLIGRADSLLGNNTSEDIGNKIAGIAIGMGLTAMGVPAGMQIGTGLSSHFGLGESLGPSSQTHTGNLGSGGQLDGLATSIAPSVQPQAPGGYSINGIPIAGGNYNPLDPLNTQGLAINGQPINNIIG